MQNSSFSGGPPPDQPRLAVFNPDADSGYPPGMTPGPTVKEVIDRYLLHSEKTGVHGDKALYERRYTLGKFAEAALPDGRKIGDLTVGECMPHMLADWIEESPT